MAEYERGEPSVEAEERRTGKDNAPSGRERLWKSCGTMGYDAAILALKPQPQPASQRDLPDPAVAEKEETFLWFFKTKKQDPYAYEKNVRGAKLFGPNGIQASDVRQGGQIGDCYLAAALAAVAAAQSDAITKAIKDNGDGTFTVTFHEFDYQGKSKKVQVTVDSDLPHDGSMPAYAKSTEKVDGKEWMELWPSVLEKAYASWKGSYDQIGHGGRAGAVMEALTGVASQPDVSTSGDADALWEKMKKATKDRKPMTAGTGAKDDKRYKDPAAVGVYGWHAYTVLGVEEKKDGGNTTRQVTLRNPWARRRRDEDAKTAGDTSNDPVFTLDYDEFRRLYDDVTING